MKQLQGDYELGVMTNDKLGKIAITIRDKSDDTMVMAVITPDQAISTAETLIRYAKELKENAKLLDTFGLARRDPPTGTAAKPDPAASN